MFPRNRWGVVAGVVIVLSNSTALGTDVDKLLSDGEQAFVAGDLEKALEMFSAVIETDPDRWEGYYYSGMVLQSQGKAKEAIEMYLDALAAKPDATEPLNNLSVAYLDAGQLDKALESCNKAMKADPENFEAAYNLGVVLEQKGEHEKAVKAYIASAALAPSDPDPYIDVAEILFGQQDTVGAGKALAEAFARAPNQIELGLKALELLTKSDENAQAITLAKKIAKRLASGGKPEDVLRVARSLRVMGEPQAALALLASNPEATTSFSLVTEMGLCQLALGDCKAGAKTFDLALTIKPQSTAAMLAKADALCCSAKWCKAKKAYKKFLASASPSDPNVQKVKAKLAEGKKGCKNK
jgi:tetratricopeptide (TPR) repeat protein